MLTIWLNHMVNMVSSIISEKKILRAAHKVFRERGMDGARMQDISDEAGINKALLHYYFRSKELLFEKVFKENADSFFSDVNAVLTSDKDLFVKIRLLCETYMDMCQENPHLPVFIITEINKHGNSFINRIFPGGVGKPDFVSFKAQIDKEVKSGKIKPVHPAFLIMNILSLCLFPAMARPMMQFTMDINNTEFRQIMEDRRKRIPDMIIESIRKK